MESEPLNVLEMVNKPIMKLLQQTKQLFQHLLLEEGICLRCIFRLYAIQSLSFYRDPSFYLNIVARFAGNQALTIYKVNSYATKLICWLCEGLLQRQFIKAVSEEIFKQLKQREIKGLKKYKLNVKFPNFLTVKYFVYQHQLLLRLYQKFQQKQLILRKILLSPVSNQNLEPKTIIKWLISAQLNGNMQIPLQSTINQDEHTVIANLQIDYLNFENENNIMNVFLSEAMSNTAAKTTNPYKKIKLQRKDISCTQLNIGRITKMEDGEIAKVLAQLPSQNRKMIVKGLVSLQSQSTNYKWAISLRTENIYLCGKYIKYSRYLPQTPWIINKQRLTPSSLQQQIENRIYRYFYPNQNLQKDDIDIKFHSGGREDIDVRMLVGGRPFVLEFVNPLVRLQQLDLKKLSQALTKEEILQIEKACQIYSQKVKIVKYLEAIVNKGNKFVQIRQFLPTTDSYISKQLKQAEIQKVKHYICYIQTKQPITVQNRVLVDSIVDLKLNQKTPLRVLHRRTLMVRQKEIHKMKMKQVSPCSAVLQIWASAGTYIKQFVHGDLNRTRPNLGQIIEKEVDILQLDVGSLKQGQWDPDDIAQMKLGKLQWEQ